MVTTITREQLDDALYEAELDEDALYDDYSGRAMYGAKCIGIVGTVGDAIEFLLALSEQGVERYELRTIANDTRTDNLGTDIITYWPCLQLQQEEATA